MASASIDVHELITMSAPAARPSEQAPAAGSQGVRMAPARKAQNLASGEPVTLTLERSMCRSEESFEPTGVTFSFAT